MVSFFRLATVWREDFAEWRHKFCISTILIGTAWVNPEENKVPRTRALAQTKVSRYRLSVQHTCRCAKHKEIMTVIVVPPLFFTSNTLCICSVCWYTICCVFPAEIIGTTRQKQKSSRCCSSVQDDTWQNFLSNLKLWIWGSQQDGKSASTSWQG